MANSNDMSGRPDDDEQPGSDPEPSGDGEGGGDTGQPAPYRHIATISQKADHRVCLTGRRANPFPKRRNRKPTCRTTQH